jgi:hypothetical protein
MCNCPTRPNARPPNIFDYMATSWDEGVLKDAMIIVEEAVAETMPLSFKFIDQIRHFNCLLYRTGLHYLIGGCNVKYDITPFPRLESAYI